LVRFGLTNEFAFAIGYHLHRSGVVPPHVALPQSNPRLASRKAEWVQNGMRGPPTGSANLAMDKSPVERGTTRAYFNTLARGVYSLQFPPVDIDGLMCADAITPKRLWRFPGSQVLDLSRASL
jgi:hypothetical protein